MALAKCGSCGRSIEVPEQAAGWKMQCPPCAELQTNRAKGPPKLVTSAPPPKGPTLVQNDASRFLARPGD